MTLPQPRFRHFAGFRLDTVSRELTAADGTVVALAAKAFDVLVYLIEHRDRVVDKDELLATVWSGRVVEENTLTQAISALRRGLGTGAGDHRYVLTVPGRGYRFIAELEPSATTTAKAPTPAARTRARRGAIVLAVVCLLAVMFAVIPRDRRPSGADAGQPVAGTPAGEAASRVAHSPCDGADPQAHRAYLRGRLLLDRPAPDTLDTAMAAFTDAIARDPTCARAWAGVAAVQRLRAELADQDPRRAFALSIAAVDRALAIDPDSAEAHVGRAYYQSLFEWDWQAAEETLRHALALDPGLAEAHLAMARLLNLRGRHQDGVVYARRAVALAPVSPWANAHAALFVRNAGYVAESRLLGANALEMAPDFWFAVYVHAYLTMAQGDAARAVQAQERAVSLAGRNSRSLRVLGAFYVHAGRRDEAQRVLRELETREGYVPPTATALVRMHLGDAQGSLDMLERGYRLRDPGMAAIRDWFGLQGEPRFAEMLQRMRLQEAPRVSAAAPPRRGAAGECRDDGRGGSLSPGCP